MTLGIELPDTAQPAVSDAEKAAAKNKPAVEGSPDDRFVLCTVSRKVAAKAVSRPSGAGGRDSYMSDPVASVTMAQQDWAQVGISGETVQWNPDNKWQLPAGQFSDQQLDCLLVRNSKRFELVDGRGKKVTR